MKKHWLILCGAVLLSACVDNEESFVIQHAKALPDPPQCEVSEGDPHVPGYAVNIMTAAEPNAWLLVANNLMKQEDFGMLKAESNGIIVDNYEVYTQVPGAGVIEGGDTITYNYLIEPESEAVLPVHLLTPATLEALRNNVGCVSYGATEIAQAILNGDQAMLGRLEAQAARMPSEMYTVVRYHGHTQGGKKLETQEFSIRLYTTCGVTGGWTPCFEDPCYAFCNDNAVIEDACYAGVNQPMTCADYLSNVDPPDVTVTDPTTGEVTVESWCKVNCAD